MTARELLLVVGSCLHSCLQNTACIGCFQALLASSLLCCCKHCLPMLFTHIPGLLADHKLLQRAHFKL